MTHRGPFQPLPFCDPGVEEGSWGHGWLAGRGAIPLLWGLNANYILNEQVIGLISRCDCSQRSCTVPRPRGRMGMTGCTVCAVRQRVTYGRCRRGARGGFIVLFAQVNHRR